jgi:predicted nucleic acid-binding protein
MSVLLDTSALIAVRNADDNKHTKTLEMMTPALQGESGKVFVSD